MARLQSGTRIYGNAIIDTSLSIDGNTAATSTSTGALKVSGGMGVIGNIYSSGNITVINASLGNIASANYLTGTLTTSSQPNITGVGTLTNLTVTNALSAGTLNVGDTTIAGNLVVTGTTITANVASISVKDPIIEQGGTANGSSLLSDDGMDRGQLLHYYSSGNQVNAFMGWKNANSEFVFAKSSTISNNVVTVGELGNVRANYFIGNIVGSVQTAVSVTNNAQPNITSVGTLTDLTVDGNLNATITTGSQPNITSLGTLTSLNVTGITNLGNIGNIKLYGGSNSYLLKTDGTGNLSWVSPETSSLTSVVDIFSGDGSQTTFTLASAPKDANFTMVAVQGILQPKNSYSVLGTALTFSSAPPPSSIVEVTAFGGSVNNGSSGSSGGTSSALTWNIASINATMATNNGYFVDTSTSAKTMTLPTGATLGDTIRINDLAGSFGTNNLTVARNGHKIQGIADNLLIDVDQSSFGLVYSNSTYGWKVLEL